MKAALRNPLALGASLIVILAIAAVAGVALPWRAIWGLALLLPLGLLGMYCAVGLLAIDAPRPAPAILYAPAVLALLSLLLVGAAPSETGMEHVALSGLLAAAMLAAAAFGSGRGAGFSVGSLFLWLTGSTLLAFDVLVRPGSPWVSDGYGILFAATALSGGLGLMALLKPDRSSSAILVGAAALALFAEFVQYIVFWSGGRPDRLIWYLERTAQPWPAVAAVGLVLVIAGMAAGVAGRVRAAGALVLAGSLVIMAWRTVPETPDVGPVGLVAGLLALALAAVGFVPSFRRRL